MSYDSRPQNMLSKAVDEVCEIDPRLVLMPYEQMKAAALRLAERLTAQSGTCQKDIGDLRKSLAGAVDERLNEHLIEMKPEEDDSITGFNAAWDIVREVFKESA
jgi:hypothetical protein